MKRMGFWRIRESEKKLYKKEESRTGKNATLDIIEICQNGRESPKTPDEVRLVMITGNNALENLAGIDVSICQNVSAQDHWNFYIWLGNPTASVGSTEE